MNQGGRTVADAVLRMSPAQPVFHWRASRTLAVLAYHDIRDPDRFEAHLDHLRRKAYPVSLPDVVRAAQGGPGLPPKAALVTFDDGHRDVLDVAMPLLVDRGMPAAAFVVAGLIDTQTPPWWTEMKDLVGAGGRASAVNGLGPEDAVRAMKRVPDRVRRDMLQELRLSAPRPAHPIPQLRADELRRLQSQGIAVGNHSLTHPCLSRCDAETIRSEVERSQDVLARAVGHPVSSFAYPDGDHDARVSRALRSSGVRAAFLFDHRLSAPRLRDPLHISRLRVDADASLDRFRIVVSGLHPTLHRMRGLS